MMWDKNVSKALSAMCQELPDALYSLKCLKEWEEEKDKMFMDMIKKIAETDNVTDALEAVMDSRKEYKLEKVKEPKEKKKVIVKWAGFMDEPMEEMFEETEEYED